MQMPVLAMMYAIFLSLVMLAGTHKSLKQHRPFWYTLLGLGHSIILLVLFIGYWSPQLVRPLGPIALVLFACCLAEPVLNIPGFLRDIDAPEFGPQLNRIHKTM